MAKMIVILMALALAGCSTIKQEPKIEYITASCPAPPKIPRPELEIDLLKDGDDAGTVIQAHRITIKTLQKWGLEQEAILNGYRKTNELRVDQ